MWSGSATTTGYGVTVSVGEGLEATSDSSIDYVVTEVVAVVDDPDED